MAAYNARQSTYVDGNIIAAADSNDEFNVILAAFNASSGHKHDGTAGEGAYVTSTTQLTISGALYKSVGNSITAGTTQTQAGATALTKDINRITTSGTDGDGVKLPAAVAGAKVEIINDDPAETIKIWPATGDAIDGGSANAVDANTLAAGSDRTYFSVDATNWYTKSSDELVASATVAGIVELATTAEVNTGSDDTRAITPVGLTAWTGDTALVTTGALNAGSITSGFGAIDNGASAITTTGIITGGSVVADDITINTKSIVMTGSSSDTVTMTAATDGAFSLVTVDAAGAAGNIQITADGTFEVDGTTITLDSAGAVVLDGGTTVDINSAGVLTLDSGAAINIEPVAGSAILLDGTISIDAGVVTGATSITSTTFVGALTGNASGTAATVTGGTQASITTVANVTTVGTIGTGVWQGTAINATYLDGQSGTNTGDEIAASLTAAGVIEIATTAEVNTGSDDTRAVSPVGLTAWTGDTAVVTVGTIGTGTWQGTAINQTYLTGQSGTNTGDEAVADATTSGTVELATDAETITGTDAARAVTPAGLQAKVAGAAALGIVELATTAETTTGTDAARVVTPDGLHDMTSLSGAAWMLDEDAMGTNSATKVASQQSIKAYVDGATGGNIVATGALDAGSITSNFGTINTGSSAITTTGAITGGSLVIGSANIIEAELEALDALARGSIIYGNASAATATLTKGAANTVLTSDGTDISWAAAAGGGAAQNLVINGGMTVSQRPSTAITASAYGGVDQWKIHMAATAGRVTVYQHTVAPVGHSWSCYIDCTTAESSLAAADVMLLRHRIEAQNLQHLRYGVGTSQDLTLSFWMRSPKSGTHCVSLNQPDQSSKHYISEFTMAVADTWEHFEITIPGDDSGVINNDSGAGLDINFPLVCGSTFQNTKDTWAAGEDYGTSSVQNLLDNTSNYVLVTGVQLEVGDSASNFVHENIATTLNKCQRYLEVWGDATVYARLANGVSVSANTIYAGMFWHSPFRSAPGVTAFGTIYANATGGTAGNTVGISHAMKDSMMIELSGGSGMTIGNGALVATYNAASDYLVISAEL